MKRRTMLLYLLLLLVLMVPIGNTAMAQTDIEVTEVTREMTETDPRLQLFLHNWLSLFPISAQKNDFKVNQLEQKLYNPGTDLSTQTVDGKQFVTISRTPDGATEHDGMIRIQGAGNLETFFVTMKVEPTVVEPKRFGGCYLGYLNETTGRKIFVGIMNGSPYIEIREKDAQEGKRIRIETADTVNQAKITLIRIFDTTFVLLDDVLVREFKDGDDGKFQLIYGPVLYRDGEMAQCTYDDLYLRKAVN